jgi:tetratricopeptide (TPR) repeat protein
VRFTLAGILAAVCAAQTPPQQTIAPPTVTMEQLTHRVPAGAAREYRASLRALESGDLTRSIEHCRKAIAADPGNASAHNDLGVLYLNANRPADALGEFDRAAELQPNLATVHVHASFAALSVSRPGDAEASARRAIELDRHNHRAHLLLGWSLVAQFQYTAAALESLRIAVQEFPEAHLAMADVLMHQGSIATARSEVEAYLAAPHPEQMQLAEAWLKMLTLE